MELATEGMLILLVSRERKQRLIQLKAGKEIHTSHGIIRHDDLIGQPLGREVRTHLGHPFLVVEPSTADLVRLIKRNTQIMFPKDVSYVLTRLSLFAGKRVIEAGTGSGGLTLALARQVMPTGRVYSYEVNPQAQKLAALNLEQAGLRPYVELKLRDISAGFDESDVDALFLDLRHPWEYLSQAQQALKPGGFFGAIVPTTNQVSALVDALQRQGCFAFIEVEELLLRPYKAVPARLRPMDRMVAHTGYLVFARHIAGGLDPSWAWMDQRKKMPFFEEEDEEISPEAYQEADDE
ncbi:MAG: tRNA (adenine-N1)-methyltransferase [Anaerolineae bacterium]